MASYIMNKLQARSTFLLLRYSSFAFLILFVFYHLLSWNLFNSDYNSVGIKSENHASIENNVLSPADHFIVPNIIHFIRFYKSHFSFIEYMCIMAAFKNQRPDYIYIHTNSEDTFYGKYWAWMRQNAELMERIRILHRPVPAEALGETLNPAWTSRLSDIVRLQVLSEYGGIYLDDDIYVVNSLDKYRKFEFAMNWNENQPEIGNQVLIAHKESRFLKLFIKSHSYYRTKNWVFNAAIRPVEDILYNHPELIHRIEGDFSVDNPITKQIYNNDTNFNWRQLEAIHLLVERRPFLDPKGFSESPSLDDINIKKRKIPLGDMAQEILNYRTVLPVLPESVSNHTNMTHI